MTACCNICDTKFVFAVDACRYVCLGGSNSPVPSDGSHGYLCPAGHSCPVGSTRELPCEPGTYSLAPGAAHCTTCPQGTMCSSSATQEPSICPAGERDENNPLVEYATIILMYYIDIDNVYFCRSFLSHRNRPASALPSGDFQQPDRSPLSLFMYPLFRWSVLQLIWSISATR